NNTQGMLPNNGGAAGVDKNIQVPTTGGDGSKISSNSGGSNTVTNYEISRKVISQKDGNYTNIKRITASGTFGSASL
ncbi:flagellar M-ring protein FliF, partial [Aliarcobacter butzleri]